jgi:hypothetical protein
MSFSLHFFLGARAMASEQLFVWANANGHFRKALAPNGGFRLDYENADTGVYFSLEQSHRPPPTPSTHHLMPAYLSATLNYLRARFFALEASEVIMDLINQFGLVLQDPQSGAIGQPTAMQLVRAWTRGNQDAVNAMRALGQTKPGMTSADTCFHYRRNHASIKAEFGEDFMVPKLVTVSNGIIVQSLAILVKPTRYVMPPADLFFIERNGAPHIVQGSHVKRALAPYCTVHRTRPGVAFIGEDKLFEPGVMDAWDRLYAEVPVEGLLSRVQSVNADAFIDA